MQQQPETFSVADRVCTALLLALPAGSSLELDEGVSTYQRKLHGQPPATEHAIKVWSGGRGVLVTVSNFAPGSDGPEFLICRLDDRAKVDPIHHLIRLEDLVACIQTSLEAVALCPRP